MSLPIVCDDPSGPYVVNNEQDSDYIWVVFSRNNEEQCDMIDAGQSRTFRKAFLSDTVFITLFSGGLGRRHCCSRTVELGKREQFSVIKGRTIHLDS